MATAWEIAADLLDPPVNPHITDPAGWVTARLKGALWSEQVRIARSVVEHPRTAVRACHGPGKSATAGRIACWWIDVHPPGTAFVVTSAPTDKQVKAILWREISRAHTAGGLPGKVLQTAEWKIDDRLVAFGRKPADHDEDGFQGIHDRHVLVILDEAGGIPQTLWTGALTLLTNEAARILVIGNPDHPDSEFARICEGADIDSGGMSSLGWNVIPIPAFATPAFTGERIPEAMAEALTSRMWARDFARDMGGPALAEAHDALTAAVAAGATISEGLERIGKTMAELINASPLYVSKVLARFPGDVVDGVVPWSWLRACVTGGGAGMPGADEGEDGEPEEEERWLGVDVGGSEASDSTVIQERVGAKVGRRWAMRSSDPERVADAICAAIDEVEPDGVNIDSIGIGWGVMGMVRRARRGVRISGVNVGEGARDKARFVNLRAELWWTIARELSRDRAWDLSGATPDTLTELSMPRWRENQAGRIVVESKDEIRKRLGRSTDSADALILAFVKPPRARVRFMQ